MKADSGFLKLQVQDFAKGLIVAVLGAVLAIIQTSIEAGNLHFDWSAILKTAGLAALAYITKNWLTNNKGQFGVKDVPKP